MFIANNTSFSLYLMAEYKGRK